MSKGRIGTASSIISVGFPQNEIRTMLRKALAKKRLSKADSDFLNRMKAKKKLSQLERQRIRRIYLNS